MWYLYTLRNEEGGLYIGSTGNLKKRLREHNSRRCKSTCVHQWEIIYCELYISEADAREREHQLKYHGQAKAWLKRRLKHILRQDQS